MLFITKGHCYLGDNPHFESDSSGGSVAVGEWDEKTNKPVPDTVRVYADWQASMYLGKVLELLDTKREIDIPDFKSIFKALYDDGIDICDHCCESFNCRDCIVHEWKEAGSNA